MLTTNWIVLLSSPLSRLQFPQRRFSSFDLSYQGTVLHVTSVLFKLALVQRKLWHFCVMFAYGFLFTYGNLRIIWKIILKLLHNL